MDISIHALRVESDIIGSNCQQISVEISIHALRVESDIAFALASYLQGESLSVWRATD